MLFNLLELMSMKICTDDNGIDMITKLALSRSLKFEEYCMITKIIAFIIEMGRIDEF